MMKIVFNKKKIIPVAGIMIILAIIYALYTGQQAARKGHIISKGMKITLEDVAKFKKKNIYKDSIPDKTADTQANNTNLITPETLKYFRYVESLFKNSKTTEEHLAKVKDYLTARLSKDRAARIFALYKKYLNCKIELVRESASWPIPGNADDMIDLLRQMQDFRRDRLGAELADSLFGPEVKSKEYSIRRGSIINNQDLYGAEKEDMIKQLNKEMWGDEAEDVENIARPYNHYREKLSMYKKDMDEMQSDEEKQAKIKEFRKEYFSDDIVKRLEEVDRQINEEKSAEAGYEKEKAKITDDTRLSADEKADRIKQLRDKRFGGQADVHKRRDAIRVDRYIDKSK